MQEVITLTKIYSNLTMKRYLLPVNKPSDYNLFRKLHFQPPNVSWFQHSNRKEIHTEFKDK